MNKPNRSQDKGLTQKKILLEFFHNNPNRDIHHPEVVDWVTSEYKIRTGKIFRDPDRGIRQLHQNGLLIKVSKGVYRYDPSMIHHRKLEDFTPQMKEAIFKKDGYKCVMCGKGPREGVEIYADHIKPKDLGGEATIENGQTLCGPHNWLKKNLKQTETGKKLFIHLYDLAKSKKNKSLLRFCTEILEVFEKNDINGHIKWTR